MVGLSREPPPCHLKYNWIILRLGEHGRTIPLSSYFASSYIRHGYSTVSHGQHGNMFQPPSQRWLTPSMTYYIKLYFANIHWELLDLFNDNVNPNPLQQNFYYYSSFNLKLRCQTLETSTEADSTGGNDDPSYSEILSCRAGVPSTGIRRAWQEFTERRSGFQLRFSGPIANLLQ